MENPIFGSKQTSLRNSLTVLNVHGTMPKMFFSKQNKWLCYYLGFFKYKIYHKIYTAFKFSKAIMNQLAWKKMFFIIQSTVKILSTSVANKFD